jgi:hypothetical protein
MAPSLTSPRSSKVILAVTPSKSVFGNSARYLAGSTELARFMASIITLAAS